MNESGLWNEGLRYEDTEGDDTWLFSKLQYRGRRQQAVGRQQERTKLLHVAGEAADEGGGGLVAGKGDAAFGLADSLATRQQVEEGGLAGARGAAAGNAACEVRNWEDVCKIKCCKPTVLQSITLPRVCTAPPHPSSADISPGRR